MDFTKLNLEKELVAKIPNVPESIQADNTEHHFLRFPLTDNESIVEKMQRHLYFSKETIDTLKTENKMLKFEVKVKEKRMAVAEQDVREKDATIEMLKTWLCGTNEEHNKNKAESNQENIPRGIRPEIMYDEKDSDYYHPPLKKALQTLERENQKNSELLDTKKTLRENIKIPTTTSTRPRRPSGVLLDNSSTDGTRPLKASLTKSKQYIFLNY